MKKIQLLSILVLSGAVLFGGKAAANKANVSFTKSDLARVESMGSVADLKITADKAIHGLQFDIKYNPAEIKSITPAQISGFEVKYNELSDGLIRGLVFSMQGQALPEDLKFEFLNADGFGGTSTIEFQDIILADSQGNGFEGEAQTYDVSYASAIPVKTELSGSYPNPLNPLPWLSAKIMSWNSIVLVPPKPSAFKNSNFKSSGKACPCILKTRPRIKPSDNSLYFTSKPEICAGVIDLISAGLYLISNCKP
jgi:hypothetical protein